MNEQQNTQAPEIHAPAFAGEPAPVVNTPTLQDEPQRRSVLLPDENLIVNTSLRRAQDLQFAINTELRNKNKDRYFAYQELDESIPDTTNRIWKTPFRAVSNAGVSMWQAAERTMGGSVGAVMDWYEFGTRKRETERRYREKLAELEKGAFTVAGAQTLDRRKQELNEAHLKELEQISADYEDNRRLGRNALLIMNENHQHFREQAGIEKNEQDGFIYDLFGAGGSLVFAIGLTVLTGSPAAAAVAFGTTAGQQDYEEALKNGVSPTRALLAGIGGGVAEGGIELLGMEMLFKSLTRTGVLGRIAAAALSEGSEEAAQQTAEEVIMQNFGGRVQELEETLKGIGYSFVLGSLTAVPVAVLTSRARAHLQEKGVNKETADKMALNMAKAVVQPENKEKVHEILSNATSPLMYPKGDVGLGAQQFKEAVDTARNPDRQTVRAMYAAGEKVERQARQAGYDEHSAELMGNLEQARFNSLHNQAGLKAGEFEETQIEFANEAQPAEQQQAQTDERVRADVAAAREQWKREYEAYQAKQRADALRAELAAAQASNARQAQPDNAAEANTSAAVQQILSMPEEQRQAFYQTMAPQAEEISSIVQEMSALLSGRNMQQFGETATSKDIEKMHQLTARVETLLGKPAQTTSAATNQQTDEEYERQRQEYLAQKEAEAKAAAEESDRKMRKAGLPPDFDFTLSQERYEAEPRVNPEDITEVHNQVTGEVIPLEMNTNLRPFVLVKLNSDFLPIANNTAAGKKQLIDFIFGKNEQIEIKKDGKTFLLSRSSVKKMQNTGITAAQKYANEHNLSTEERQQLYHDVAEQIAQALKVFNTAQLILSHQDVKNVKCRNILRYANIFKYRTNDYYAMFVIKNDGTLTDLHLYDLQTEKKYTAGNSSVIVDPSQQPYNNNINDLVRFVKRKIAKYNKNIKKGTRLELLQENLFDMQQSLFDGPQNLFESQVSAEEDKGATQEETELKEAADGLFTEEELKETLPPFKPSAAPERIEDFGEKIHGARKDLWGKYARAMNEEITGDAKEITLARFFPEPNYEAAIAQGITVEQLAVVKALRDSIPVKPQRYGVEKWVEGLKSARRAANLVLNSPQAVEDVKRLIPTLDRSLNGTSGRIDLYLELGYPAFTKAKNYSIHTGHYLIYRGQRFDQPTTIYELRRGYRTLAHSQDKDGIIAAARELMTQTPAKTKAPTKLDIYQTRLSGEIIIGKKIASGKYIDLKGGFTRVKDAMEFLKENQAHLEALLAQKRTIYPVRKETNDPRVGKEYRPNNTVVKPERFAQEFGFRGVQFGNWVEQKKRAADLNNAYDALLDMAHLINIPARAVSLDGTLGLAFGARGTAGAKAHYEPNEVVINLTKEHGAGSLGHEWWHALDNYFGRTRSPLGMITAAPNRYENVRPEMRRAYDNVVQMVRLAIGQRSREMDKTRTKDYWSSPEEMTARAFETYLIFKAKKMGYSNDYLANIVSPQAYLGDPDTYPYPLAQEMPAIEAAFDNFFAVLKTKPSPKGYTLYEEPLELAGDNNDDISYFVKARNPKTAAGKLQNMLPPDAEPVAKIDTKQLGFSGTIKEIKTKLIKWYKDNLQGTSAVNPELGKVDFTGAGISEVKGKALTQQRAYLVTAAKSVIEKGTVVGEHAEEKHPQGIKKFYFVQGKVEVDSSPVIMQVDVAEDGRGKKFYYVSETKTNNAGEVTRDQNTGFPNAATDSITQNRDIVKAQVFNQSQRETAPILDSGSTAGMTAEDTSGFGRAQAQPVAPSYLGKVSFDMDKNRAVIAAAQSANKSTALHEFAHVWEHDLFRAEKLSNEAEFLQMMQDLRGIHAGSYDFVIKYLSKTKLLNDTARAQVLKTIKERGGEEYIKKLAYGNMDVNESQDTTERFVRRAFRENFANLFEKYVMKGSAPSAAYKKLFTRFAQWLREIYGALAGVEISPDVQKFFDKLLTREARRADSKLFTGKVDALREQVKNIQHGSPSGNFTLEQIKGLVSVLDAPAPKRPQTHLLKDLRRYGANYASAGRIDKESYKNARVFNKQTGIGDDPARWLTDHGYMAAHNGDGSRLTYEDIDRQNEQAYDMIERAMDGEIIYPIGEEAAAEEYENYTRLVDTVREVWGDPREAKKTLKSILELEEKGYRVVEKKDLTSLSLRLGELNKLADRLDNKSQTVRDKEEAEKATLDAAQKIKRRIVEELDKREVEGKSELIKQLKNAKTFDDIQTATAQALNFLEDAYEKTEAGQEERRRTDLPNTDWQQVRAQLLRDYTDSVGQVDERVREAWKVRTAITTGSTSLYGWDADEVQRRRQQSEKVLAEAEPKLEAALMRATSRVLYNIGGLESDQIRRLLVSYGKSATRQRALYKNNLDGLVRRAQELQEDNYKKYMNKKIQDVLNLNLFDSRGNLRKATVDAGTMTALQELKRVAHLGPQSAADELAARMERFTDAPASPTDKIVNELLSIQAYDRKDVSVQLYKQAYEDITALRKSGRSAKNLQKMIMDFRTEQDKSEVLNAIGKNKEAGLLKRMYASWLANWESFLDLITDKNTREKYSMLNLEADATTYTWQRRTDIMDGVKRIYNLGNKREVQDKMNELRKEKHTFTNYANVDKNEDPYVIKRTGKPFQEELSKMQLITAYIYYQNENLAERLTQQYGNEQLAAMWDLLDKQDKALAKFLQEQAELSYAQINEVFVRERGYDLPRVQNYFPSVTERVESELDFLHAAQVMSKNPSFIKMRASSPFIQMRLENPFGILFRHIDRAADYHFKAEKLNQIRRVFKSPVLKPAIIEKVGEDVYKRMLELIDQFSVQKPRLNYEMDKLGDWLTNNYVKGAIALKPTIAIKQLISSINYAEQMPTTQWIAGFTDAILHPKQTVKFMMEGDPYLKARFESGSMNEALARATADANAITAKGKFLRFTDLLTINTRFGDIGAIMFGGKPYVDYLINEKGMSKKEAFAEFRKATLRSQQSNTRSSLSTLQARDMNFIVRGLFAFKNTPAQYARKIADAISQYQRGEIDKKQLAKVVAIYGLLNSWMYSMLTSLGLLAWFYDNDDAAEMLADELFFSPFTQMAGALPVLDVAVGQAANVAKAKLFDHRVHLERPELPVVSELFKMGGKALKEEVSAGDILDMLLMGGQLFGGLPTQYAKGVFTGAADVATGENPMRGFLQALGYTENRAQIATNTKE